MSYINLNQNKCLIYKENREKSGIYRWVNLTTGESYVGSAADLTHRLYNYFSPNTLKRELKRNRSLIYSSILKYGYSNFSLDILEYCDSDIILNREQYYIDLLEPEYNLLKVAGRRSGFKHTEETKSKMSKSAKLRLGFNHHYFGKNLPIEVKAKISISKSLPVKVINVEENSYKIFLGNKEVQEYLNIPRSSLIRAKKLKCLVKKKYLIVNV